MMKLEQKMYGSGISKWSLYKKYLGVWIKVYSSFDREDCVKQSIILKGNSILSGVEYL